MKTITLNNIISLVLSCMLLAACQGMKKSENTAKAVSGSNNTEEVESSGSKIRYVVANHYFVRNDVKIFKNTKITTQEAFDKIFGCAAVMGKDGMPTSIDFAKQYVIAVIKPETDRPTTLIAKNLMKNAEGKIVFSYKALIGEKQTYTMVPSLIIVVDKTNTGDIVFKESN